MPLIEVLRQAFQNLRANRLRAILTLLIIAFGIMALVGILTAIDAIAYSLNDNFSGLGANSFAIERKSGASVRGVRQKTGKAISYREAETFKEQFRFPARVSLSFSAGNLFTIKHGDQKTNPNVSIIGIDEQYLQIKGLELEVGRAFSPSEVNDGLPRALIGRDVVKSLFRDKPERALNQVIVVQGARYLVAGVLKSKGATMGANSDRAIYIPVKRARLEYASPNTNYDLIVAVNNAIDIEAAQSEAIGLMRAIRRVRPGEDEDFELRGSDSLVSILKENTTTLRLGTIAIGLMTLLGAAIGLMNIMLVSVTERTREIGIYKALGATQRNILWQFLTEAVVISQLGGVLGIALGILIGNAVTPLLGGSFLAPWGWMALSFILCTIVGIMSGFYPAMKAAKLDPIEALRYE
ncbi:MAG: ABC transporter permease [Saprospiraceae bacterium]